MSRCSILVYADVNLNLIDGSAIWVTSLVEMLTQEQDIVVYLLLKTPLTRDIVVKNLLNKTNVRLLDPWDKSGLRIGRKKSLTPGEIGGVIKTIAREREIDLIIARGLEVCANIIQFPELASKTWAYVAGIEHIKENPMDLERLRQISAGADRMLCQTEQIKGFIKEMADGVECTLLPPMIPSGTRPSSFVRQGKRLIYSGKFSPAYCIIEQLTAFEEIARKHTEALMYVAGDKFNSDPRYPRFKEDVTKMLTRTPGVHWFNGLPRHEVQKQITGSDLALSLRVPEMDYSLEMSTKVLEYSNCGKPAILNRNEMHLGLLGPDYPFYANNPAELIQKVNLAFSDDRIYRDAAEHVYKVSQRFTFSSTWQDFKKYLPLNDIIKVTQAKKKLLVAGHDLKFINHIIMQLQGDYKIKIDHWHNHNAHDEGQSAQLLEWADVIFCEWCLGNAVWYSQHKKAGQKLVVRLHRQEITTPYINKIKQSAVDKIIFIAPHVRDEFIQLTGFDLKKSVIIFNAVDCAKFNQEKLPGAEFNFGFLGFCPRLKRLDRALDIFEAIWSKDHRYNLFVKGKMPTEYDWLWKKEEERSFYRRLFKRINQSKWRNAVVFEGWGEDIDQWMRKIGFMLSTSDIEGSHQAVAEAMASGAIPLIAGWPGANTVYPADYIASSERELILRFQGLKKEYLSNSNKVTTYAVNSFDINKVIKLFFNIFTD